MSDGVRLSDRVAAYKEKAKREKTAKPESPPGSAPPPAQPSTPQPIMRAKSLDAALHAKEAAGTSTDVYNDGTTERDRIRAATQQAEALLKRTASGKADGQGGYDPRTAVPGGQFDERSVRKKAAYELDQDDLDYQKAQLERAQRRLMAADKEHIKATINSIDDIESGVWAAPFFGAFASMRALLLILCGQVTALCSVAFSEGGLAFPAWVCFSLAIATIITGFPTWWEPMTNNHARLHIITAGLSAAVTAIVCTFLSEKFEIADARQRCVRPPIARASLLRCEFAVTGPTIMR